MAYATGTLHYNLPQTVGTDVRDWSDTNQAFEDVDTALYGAVSDVATASAKVDALDEELNDASTGVVAQLGQAQTDIIGLDGRVQTLEGTVSNHTLQIADVRSDCEDMICAFNETTSTSAHDYAIGDYFRYNDVLYIATAVINIGDTITPDTNCATTNVTTELLDIKSSAVDKVGDLSNLTTTDKDNCVDAINEINANVGDLSNLTTTDKDNLVDAINEIAGSGSSSDFGTGVDITSYTTASKYETPSDGYVVLTMAQSSANDDVMYCGVYNSDESSHFSISAVAASNANFATACFVKKGVKICKTVSTGSGTRAITFYPLT